MAKLIIQLWAVYKINRMFESINPAIRSVVSTISHYANLRNIIFVGSFSDYIHFKRNGLEPIKPKDLDILVTSIKDLGDLRYKVEMMGPFNNPTYNQFMPHHQYYFEMLGVRTDIFVANNISDFSVVKTDKENFFGRDIFINSKEQAIENQIKYLEIFENPRDSSELYRQRKHSKRLAFYNMMDNNLL